MSIGSKGCFLGILVCCGTVLAGNAALVIKTSDTGRIFEGIGAVSAGGNSRLLIDYPEPQRSQVLDYLFKPRFGAGFQHLKVEIGSGQNSTSGAVASHAYTDAEIQQPVSRSYELWLLREAQNRNPDLILDALVWGLPQCTKGLWTRDMASYLVSFVRLADHQWGLDMDWLGGCVNEYGGGADPDWLKYVLRPKLDLAGYGHVKIQAEEGRVNRAWSLLDRCREDQALDAVVDAVSYHYVEDSDQWPSAVQIAQGKPMWDSEQHVRGGAWKDAKDIVRTTIRNYIEGRITKHEIWPPIAATAPGVWLGSFGAMQANQPWSGSFSVRPALWGIAHVTQFVEPGWRFLDRACGTLSGQGCYATLVNPQTGDWSLIVYAENQESITILPAEGASTKTPQVWTSDGSQQFVYEGELKTHRNRLVLNCKADRIYSVTTTEGQRKGYYESSPNSNLHLPYQDDFENYLDGGMPIYLSDMQGTFQIQQARGGRDGLALQQMVPGLGSAWGTSPRYAMTVIPGPMSWADYELSADVYIDEGEIYLAVRKGNSDWSWKGLHCGYAFVLESDGDWRLHFDDPTKISTRLDQGTIGGFDDRIWHTVTLRCVGRKIEATVDGKRVMTIVDSQRSSGNACLGGSFHNHQFDNLSIQE